MTNTKREKRIESQDKHLDDLLLPWKDYYPLAMQEMQSIVGGASLKITRDKVNQWHNFPWEETLLCGLFGSVVFGGISVGIAIASSAKIARDTSQYSDAHATIKLYTKKLTKFDNPLKLKKILTSKLANVCKQSALQTGINRIDEVVCNLKKFAYHEISGGKAAAEINTFDSNSAISAALNSCSKVTGKEREILQEYTTMYQKIENLKIPADAEQMPLTSEALTMLDAEVMKKKSERKKKFAIKGLLAGFIVGAVSKIAYKKIKEVNGISRRP